MPEGTLKQTKDVLLGQELEDMNKHFLLFRCMVGEKPKRLRKRRGALNFIGQISKILFGTLDADDADYYNEQINQFEKNSEDLTNLMKQQLSIVRASLGTFNDTISDFHVRNL